VQQDVLHSAIKSLNLSVTFPPRAALLSRFLVQKYYARDLLITF
jgi:hypothetical protein